MGFELQLGSRGQHVVGCLLCPGGLGGYDVGHRQGHIGTLKDFPRLIACRFRTVTWNENGVVGVWSRPSTTWRTMMVRLLFVFATFELPKETQSLNPE